MGKTETQQSSSSSSSSPSSSENLYKWWAHLTGFLHGAFSFKCLFVFLLSVCVFLSALFWLPPFHPMGSASDSFDPEKLAGFFLNPRFQYEEGFVYSDNIRSGVTKVIERLAPNVTFAIEATREIAQFRGKIGRFGDLTAQTAVGIMNPAPVQASFRLQKSVSFLTAETERLEYDILQEIGVPDTKVSIIALHPLTTSNWTCIIFGVLPDPSDSSISQVALSVLRSSLMELVVGQWNLTLTPSLFGQPYVFEVLKFPGGITVIPPKQTPLLMIPQTLFNFSLNNSISQIQENLDQLKYQLKSGLHLRTDENLYVQVTNLNGSTLAPPAIIQSSVLSDIGSPSLLQPERLRQLAQTIYASHGKNLGLDNSIFGKVKHIQLSSYLKHSLAISPSPSPSPVEAPTPYPAEPPLSNSPAFSPFSPTPSYGTVFPPVSISPYAPSPQSRSRSPSPLSYLASPAASPIPINRSPRKSPCHGFLVPRDPLSPVYPDPPPPPDLIPSAAIPPQISHLGPSLQFSPLDSPSPAVFYSSHPPWGERNAKAPTIWLLDSSPTSTLSPSSSCMTGPGIIFIFGALIFPALF